MFTIPNLRTEFTEWQKYPVLEIQAQKQSWAIARIQNTSHKLLLHSRIQTDTNTQRQKWNKKQKQTLEQRMNKLQFADISDIHRGFISIHVSHYKLTHLIPKSEILIIIWRG